MARSISRDILKSPADLADKPISPPCASWGSETSPALCWKVALCLSKHGLCRSELAGQSARHGPLLEMQEENMVEQLSRKPSDTRTSFNSFKALLLGIGNQKKMTTNSFSSDNQGLQVSNKEIL